MYSKIISIEQKGTDILTREEIDYLLNCFDEAFEIPDHIQETIDDLIALSNSTSEHEDEPLTPDEIAELLGSTDDNGPNIFDPWHKILPDGQGLTELSDLKRVLRTQRILEKKRKLKDAHDFLKELDIYLQYVTDKNMIGLGLEPDMHKTLTSFLKEKDRKHYGRKLMTKLVKEHSADLSDITRKIIFSRWFWKDVDELFDHLLAQRSI